MGRGQKRNRFAQKRRDQKEGKPKKPAVRPDTRGEGYAEIRKENEKFVKYYQHQKVCPDGEWDQFLETLRADLPTTFRISGCRSSAKKLLDVIQNTFFDKYIDEASKQSLKEPVCLPWYPNGLAWQLELSRKDIRRTEHFYKLHNFLIAETNAGSISRQEAVSMIPPIVLDVKPGHKVLDMCAAPGSKTAQLIEALHVEENNPIPGGFVVANDVDNSRCYMLVHQAKRLNSPCFVVTNQDSSCMPAFKTKDGKPLKFDRILCDVPCSGDGTMRKNPDIWKRWHLGNALNLHGVQYRIARRGAELLDIGGRLVYSTCSLNPIENESVLHRLIKESEGALELVDIAHYLPGLKYKEGISYWELSNKECDEFYKTPDQIPAKYENLVRPQMFPPSEADAPQFALNKCLRVLPHFQNTGGFFIAALTKKRSLPWERKIDAMVVEMTEQPTNDAEQSTNDGEPSSEAPVEEKKVPWGPQRKKRRTYGYKEDPYVFFTEEEPVWRQIENFFGYSQKLNSFKSTQLLTRTLTGKKKNIYFCSEDVKNLVQANADHVKIINTGVKVFARVDHHNMECEFRMANEGLDTISAVVGEKRCINVSRNDLVLMLEHTNPKLPPEISTLSEKTQEQMQRLSSGSCIMTYNDESGLTINVVGWKGGKSLRAYVDLSECIHLLRLLGADVSKFEVNKFIKKNEEAECAVEAEPTQPQTVADTATSCGFL